MPHFRLLPIAALLALAACDLGPDYARPALEIPAAFRATTASAAQAWPTPDWWRAFGSPELDHLIADARANNQDLAAAAARVVQADAQAAIAGAPLLPSVSATASGTYSRTGSSRRGGLVGIDAAGNPIVAGGSHYTDSRQYSLQANVSYEADFWGKNRATFQSAQAAALASRFDQETVALTVVTAVATTYFEALGAADRLTVAQRNLASAQETLQVFRVRVEVGTATALDIAQQEALVAGEAAQIPAFRSQYEQQVIALGILVGRPPEDIHITANTLATLPTPTVGGGLPSELLTRRPDVANAEATLVSQNGNVRAARADFFPSIELTTAGGIESLALSTLTGPGSLVLSVAASATQTIFDNGLKQGTLDEAKGRFAELIADYRQAVLQAFTDVDTALVAVRYAAEQVTLERQAVAVAQRAADIARAQLAAGTVDITVVLNTQTTLFSDQDALAQARLVHFQALITLYKALGGGWKQPGASGTS
ncbi:MAG: efflux transporter outer membrane subunit [Acetobacteraceae bacterium]